MVYGREAADDPLRLAAQAGGELSAEGGEEGRLAAQGSLSRLRQSDLEMIRVLEDLIHLLIHKGVVRITDLPEAAQAKLMERSKARDALGGLTGLIGDEEQGVI